MSVFELGRPKQLDENGRIGRCREECGTHAERILATRCKQDTHPMIVQMVVCGELLDHYYYRSDQLIDQPYDIPDQFVQPYVGPPEDAIPSVYGQGTYVVDKEYNQWLLEQARSN